MAHDLDLLLLPSTRASDADRAAFEALGRGLAESGYAARVLVPAGDSPAAALASVLAALPADAHDLCVVGEREGSYLALRLALARPGLVTSLLLLHPHLGGPVPEAATAVLDPSFAEAEPLHEELRGLVAPAELLAGRSACCPSPDAARAAMRALPNVSLTFLAADDGSLLHRAMGRVLDDARRAARRARPALDPSERTSR